MIRVGILGASGFIGSRAVELFHAEGLEVRPIARTAANLARLSCMGLDCRIANALDRSALQAAFEGCDVVIHSVLGNPGLIRGTVVPIYQAAQKAGARRLIYLSSMCVHSQAPAPGTTEEAPLILKQPFPYNTAKIEAEQKLLQLRETGSVEVVIFRPGVVFGPHSNRVLEVANQLLKGTACLVNEGKGICNTVYIDNLIHAIRLAMTAQKADRQAFFVGDREVVTWFDFYHPFAEALGIDISQIHQVAAPELPPLQESSFSERFRESVFLQRITSAVSDEWKQRIRQLLTKQHNPKPAIPEETLVTAQPELSPEMALLQQSQYKLPNEKAKKILGYEPIVSFETACYHSIQWLADVLDQSVSIKTSPSVPK